MNYRYISALGILDGIEQVLRERDMPLTANNIATARADIAAHVESLQSTYRDFEIHHDMPPIPVRSFDWCATHKDYDGAEDSKDNRVLHAASLDGLRKEIDAWHEEQKQ